MALTWDVTDIENHEEVTTEMRDGVAHWHPVTDALVWATLFIGIPKITRDNWMEFWRRTMQIEQEEGSIIKTTVNDVVNDRPITSEDIRRHIGLRTNASSMTSKEFDKNRESCHENFSDLGGKK